MDGKQLKNSILQWAIQGKLVPQNPKDEPAQKLLERIAASRNKSSLSLPKGTSSTSLRGAKATKQSKALSSRIYRENGVWYEQVGTATPKDISDEIPFEIPENWAWCRMGNIGSWGAGATPAKGNPAFYQNGEIPWLLTGELNNSIVLETKTKISKLALEKCSLRLCKPGDILIAMYGATIGKLAIAGIELTTNQACCACTVHYDFNKYLFYFLMASKSDLIKRGEGGAQPNISKEKLVNYLMPLPPLAEQKRIVAKLEQVLPLAEEYGAAQEQLDKLNKELPEALKKSILQEAIQGKLVPQNPKDEPAQKLLERIAASRNESSLSLPKGTSSTSLRGAKATKQTKNPPSRIYRENGVWYEQIGSAAPKDISDEIPFEIPENWAWCRVQNVISLLSGRDLEPSQYNALQNGIPYMTGASNFSNEGLIINRWTNFPITISHKGDLLITCKGTIGTMAFNDVGDVHIARQIMAISSPFMNLYFIKYFLTSYVNELQKVARSMIPGISRDDLLKSFIPVPPLAEQKRIVTKLEQLFKVL